MLCGILVPPCLYRLSIYVCILFVYGVLSVWNLDFSNGVKMMLRWCRLGVGINA